MDSTGGSIGQRSRGLIQTCDKHVFGDVTVGIAAFVAAGVRAVHAFDGYVQDVQAVRVQVLVNEYRISQYVL